MSYTPYSSIYPLLFVPDLDNYIKKLSSFLPGKEIDRVFDQDNPTLPRMICFAIRDLKLFFMDRQFSPSTNSTMNGGSTCGVNLFFSPSDYDLIQENGKKLNFFMGEMQMPYASPRFNFLVKNIFGKDPRLYAPNNSFLLSVYQDSYGQQWYIQCEKN